MTTSFRIRQVDADEEHDLLVELQKTVMPFDEVVKPEEPLAWWVAYAGDAVAGYAALSASSQQVTGRGYLSAAGVLRPYRGQGLQKRLIRSRIAFARTLGMDTLVTDTVPSNPASANSLIACGFRAFVPEKPWRYPGACYWRRHIQT